MNKLLVIGIDSLAPELLVKYAKDLPNFTKLREESPEINLKSVFPVDSIPAWASIYTGWNPARHGIVKTFDVFDPDLADISNIDINIFKGKTFWDYASKAGEKVCVLYPLLGFPPWEVNGVMVSIAINERRAEGESEWVTERETRSYPSWIMEKYKIPRFMKGIYGKHPGIKNLGKWSEDGKKALINEAEIGLKLCKNEEWDFFFIYFSWLDIIQHRLWRFSDERDPSYPGVNPHKNIIKEFYQITDRIVRDFLNLCSNTTTIVFSDHGHGIRPTKVVNINKVLRENDLLFFDYKKLDYSQYVMEKLKVVMLEFVKRFELDCWLVDLSTKTKMLSNISKNVYMSTSNLNKEQSIAHLSAFAGIKSYPHGGIEIEKKFDNDMNYEEVQNKILKILLGLRDPKSGAKLVEWACKREELYQGSQVSQAYPDIVFHLKEGYGTGWNMNTPLISTAYDHNLASGGHKKDAVFLIKNLDGRKVNVTNMTLMDIAPTILDLLHIDWRRIDFDGKSILETNIQRDTHEDIVWG
jgi:predicted AlkP superfamily phosphohydrolase/phosphomutase